MAVAKFSGGKDLQGYSVGIDDLALARDFQKFAVGGNERVAVRQALATHRHVSDLVFPQ